MNTVNTKALTPIQIKWRWLELILIFGIGPLALYLVRNDIKEFVLPIVTLLGISCLAVLLKDNHFKRFRLTNKQGFTTRFKKVLISFAWLMLFSAIIFAIFSPETMFYMPTDWTQSWLLLLLLYPIFSALPQEVIFRTFLFHRYKRIIPSKQQRIMLSSLCFGFAHIIYANPIAVVLSAVAGYVFCQTYALSRSTMLVALEHSLWGAWIFTLGLGQYFDLYQLK